MGMSRSIRNAFWTTIIACAWGGLAASADIVSNQNTGVTYPSIQSAINAAASNQVLIVSTGTITEAGILLSNKWLTLRGAGQESTIIQAAASPGTASNRIFLIQGGAVVLERMTIRNGCVFGDGAGVNGVGTNAVQLNDCTLSGNKAPYGYGGGANNSSLSRCTLKDNSAIFGGGASASRLDHCAVWRNSAWQGGGTHQSTLQNSTLTGNSASSSGGGAYGGSATNSILWYNTAPVAPNGNLSASNISFSCTTPDPGGISNAVVNPLLASASHLSAASTPLMNTGGFTFPGGTYDIDRDRYGDLSGPNDTAPIGCDKIWTGNVGQYGPTGALQAAMTADATNIVTNYTVNFMADIAGRTAGSVWNFGDGTILSNCPYTSHSWSTGGVYLVSLTAWNETYPGGVSTSLSVQVCAFPNYVNVSNATPVAPYTNWATAATRIQDAIDAAPMGGTVLVTNGIYRTGGAIAPGSTVTNRILATKPIRIQSVNGAGTTIIQGLDSFTASGAVRCAYLSSNVTLRGFTLTLGQAAAESGGGACGDHSVVIADCIIVSNSAHLAGGIVGAIATNCTLSANQASDSGGASLDSGLFDCLVTGNHATFMGGGARESALIRCTLSGNSAHSGGGASGGYLVNCTLKENTASGEGGGVFDSWLSNCAIYDNSAGDNYGGGLGRFDNCTIVRNRAGIKGGGIGLSTAMNCILWGNSAFFSPDYQGDPSALQYSCTPLPGGTGCITNNPLLVDPVHISATSPCIGKGMPDSASGTDLDGDLWKNPPSIGCDEYDSASTTGQLEVAIAAAYTNAATTFTNHLVSTISGHASYFAWDFGDGSPSASDSLTPSHAWLAPGDYVVSFAAFNTTVPGGISTSLTIHVVDQPVHYVDSACATPSPPYSSWETAATTIQNAVDAADVAGALILVTNGFYDTGGAMPPITPSPARVCIAKPLTVRSVNGREVTTIYGGGMVPSNDMHCAYLGNYASLEGFTLTGGNANGGGAYCEALATLSDCTIISNVVSGVVGGTINRCLLVANGGMYGGGASAATLRNCILRGNEAQEAGGGADSCILYNCVLTSNSASYFGGGGASYSTLYNCTVVGNIAYTHPLVSGGGGGTFACTVYNSIVVDNIYGGLPNAFGEDDFASTFRYSCSSYAPGTGNIQTDPLFVDASNGNYRLRSGSPCRDAGMDLSAFGVTTDITGRRRPLEGNADGVPAFDMGAYEEIVEWHVAKDSPTNGPGDTWENAFHTIQEAVDAAQPGENVIVTNGVYNIGGKPSWSDTITFLAGFTNRVVIDKPITVHSVNGRAVTLIEGQPPSSPYAWDSVRCAYVGSNAVLEGFTLTNGWSADPSWAIMEQDQHGGGARCEPSGRINHCTIVDCASTMVGGGVYGGILSNCTLAGNISLFGQGGGAYTSILQHCTLSNNTSTADGGGAYGSLLDHCTLVANTASNWGGGAYESTLSDCTLHGNSATVIGGGAYNSTLTGCLLTGNVSGGNGGGAALGRLIQCTLVGNRSASHGGGAESAFLDHCTIQSNAAGSVLDETASGGGVSSCTLDTCLLTDNAATNAGGGAAWSALTNCTVTANRAGFHGGGACNGSAVNSIIWGNHLTAVTDDEAGTNWSYYYGGSVDINYSCTTPAPAGTGNITNAPLFVSPGNFRLTSLSPCLDRGNNTSMRSSTDLDGSRRPLDGDTNGVATVDMGCYEGMVWSSDSDNDTLPDGWEVQFGMNPVDPSDGTADPDHDKVPNSSEWIAGTDPTNASSLFCILSISNEPPVFGVTTLSCTGRVYSLEYTTALNSGIWTNAPGAPSLPGTGGALSMTATNAGSLRFYRASVRLAP